MQALLAERAGVKVELVVVETAGDKDQQSALSAGEGVGWFTRAIQDALLAGEAELAVHSYKDLPTARPAGLTIAAVPVREDPRDALIAHGSAKLATLPAGSVVGTSSPRREAQLRELRPDLEFQPIRGNVDTRIAKVEAGEYAATVLALAGLRRLGMANRASEVFGFEQMLPAAAQGALAVECRSDDEAAMAAARAIDDADLRLVVTAERAFLARLEAGCSFPAGAYAERFGSTLKLHAMVASEGKIVRSKVGGPAETAQGLGRMLAEELMARAGLG